MKLIRFDDIALYYRRVKDYLLENEAVNCLLLASCLSLGKIDCHQAHLVLIEDNRDVLTAAIQIGDRKVFLSKSTNLAAVRLIAEDLAINSKSIPGITAPQLEAEMFITAWQNSTGQAMTLEVVMSIQQLELASFKTSAIASATGKLRLAMLEEVELLTGWIQAFVKEALGIDESKADSQRWVIRHLEQDSLYVWENRDLPVSMAAYGGKTPHGIRVKSVYTPAEYRSNGYATSCVAAMSKILLTRQKYCFLFTDLANPTSNNIYGKLGYLPMGKIGDYKCC